MAREYYFSTSMKLADDEGDAGYGSGGRVAFRYDGVWLSDADIERIAADHARWIAEDFKRTRDREMERDRKLAEPFWRRWLG